MKKKVLLTSILTIALCFSLIAGSTYALFTTNDIVNVAVTAGNVELTADLVEDSLLTWSLGETEADARTDGKFANDGTAKIDVDGATVVIERMTPGDVVKFKIDVVNKSNVNVQYRVTMKSVAGNTAVDLSEALVTTAYVDGYNYPLVGLTNGTANNEKATPWRFIEAPANDVLDEESIEDIWVTVAFPNHDQDGSIDNRYKNAECKITFVVEAVQGNADHFAVSTNLNNLFEGSSKPGYFANKIHNGEGTAPIKITTPAVGLAGEVTFADITLDGTANPNAEYAMIWDAGDGVDSTLILAENATLIAAEDQDAIKVENTEPGETFTLMMDKTSKISVSGIWGHAVLAQNDGVVNLVLNGSLDELFELNNGAYAFGFAGGYYPDEYITVNFFVNSEADMAEYKAAIDPDSNKYIAHWFINGTPTDYTNN